LRNLLIKIEAEIFESIFLSNWAGAAESPAPCFGRVEVENQSEIRFAMGDGEAVDKIYFIHRETSGIALENGGGVVKTVGDNPFASGQGRKDGLADEFGSARGKEKELCLGSHGLADGIVFEELTNDFPHWGAAGFTDLENG
jgi:hypothetical protein